VLLPQATSRMVPLSGSAGGTAVWNEPFCLVAARPASAEAQLVLELWASPDKRCHLECLPHAAGWLHELLVQAIAQRALPAFKQLHHAWMTLQAARQSCEPRGSESQLAAGRRTAARN